MRSFQPEHVTPERLNKDRSAEDEPLWKNGRVTLGVESEHTSDRILVHGVYLSVNRLRT